ncbi:MAG: ABC transporter permease [Thermoproteota archaeon]
MLRYIARKLLQKLAVLYIITNFVFLIPRLAPGSPIDYLVENPRVPPEVRQELLRKFGLDRPIFPDQYVEFLKGLVRLDFGYSFTYQSPVFEVIEERLWWSILLVGSALLLSALIGTYLGMIAAWYRGRVRDYALTLSTLFVRSLPVFWVGMLLLLFFSYKLGWFPTGGATTPGETYENVLDRVADVLHHLALPLTAIVPVFTARYLMVMRNTMVDVMGEDYVVVAKAKGLSDRLIMWKHAARTALLPLVTMLSIDVGAIMGGAVITETVFSYPGVGLLIYEAVLNHDYPLILGAFFIISVVTLASMFVAELLYAALDPRVRAGEA